MINYFKSYSSLGDDRFFCVTLYLTDHDCENKKEKGTKKCLIKSKLKFKNYKNCLEANQLENKRNHLEQNKLNVDNVGENHKKIIKNNKLISKSKQRFRCKKHNAFTEEVNKTALSANDDERI